MIVSKKLKTAWSLAKKHKWPTIINRSQRNIRQLVLKSKTEKPFIYKDKIGFRYVCFPLSSASLHLYLDSGSEVTETRIAYNWLERGDSCLDIGANLGYYSALFAKQVTLSGKVIAAEAAPKTAGYLADIARILSLEQLKIENLCVTDKEGFCDFMVGSGNGDSVFQALRVAEAKEKEFERIKVKSNTIDGLVKKYHIEKNVSLIKMDIEGAEPLALKGAASLFDKEALPLFIIEINAMALCRLGFEAEDVLKFFPRDIFETYIDNINFYDSEFGTLRCLTNALKNKWPCLSNLIAVPKAGKYAGRKNRIEKYLKNE